MNNQIYIRYDHHNKKGTFILTRKSYARNEVLTINIQRRTFYYELGNNEIYNIQFGLFFMPNHKMKKAGDVNVFLI